MASVSRVFVCSTYHDLIPERQATMEAIQMLRLQHNGMEYFGARPNLPIATCLEEIANSDILLVIVGHKYGSYVPGSGLSYTESEYNEAIRLEKPCLVYMKREDTPVLPRMVEQESEKVAALKSFKRRLLQRHTVDQFDSAHTLALAVTRDVSHVIRVIESASSSGSPTLAPVRTFPSEFMQIVENVIERGSLGRALIDNFMAEATSLLKEEVARKPTVYLSHASSDSEVAQEIASGLRNSGLLVATSPDFADAEAYSSPKVAARIAEAEFFIAFVSKVSMADIKVRAEFDQALLRRMRAPGSLQLAAITPDGSHIPTLFRSRHSLDLTASSIEFAITELVQTIRVARGTDRA